jgi:apolipoprotein N-acyltransferase
MRAWLAAAVFGLVSALALPPLYVLPVLFIAVPGLLTLIDGAPNWRSAAFRGFWFGFAHHLVGLYWITEAILLAADRYWWLVPFAVPGLAAILAPFVAAACAASRLSRPGWSRAMALAGAWVLADLARQFVGTGFPWNPWGADWSLPGVMGNIFLQPAAWVSVHGLTLATLLLAATPALGWRGRAAGAAGLAVWAGLGAWRLSLPSGPAPQVAVVVVQGDVSQLMSWNEQDALGILKRYLRLTYEGLAKASATFPEDQPVVVWPESASPFPLPNDVGARAAVIAASGGAPVLAGTVRFLPDGQPANSLAAITSISPPTQVYDKWHLVPFGEYSPSWVPLSIRLVRHGGFAPGPGPKTLHVDGLPPLGPFICYEAIFPAQVINDADRPSWMVNITNDAWFGNSSGPRQHLQAARLRAVEEGLPLIRAANTGISAAFDAHGREIAWLGLGQMGSFVVRLPGALPPTLFSRFGLIVPGSLASIAYLAGLASRCLRRAQLG